MGIQGYISIQGCIDYMANASMAFSHGVYTHSRWRKSGVKFGEGGCSYFCFFSHHVVFNTPLLNER